MARPNFTAADHEHGSGRCPRCGVLAVCHVCHERTLHIVRETGELVCERGCNPLDLVGARFRVECHERLILAGLA